MFEGISRTTEIQHPEIVTGATATDRVEKPVKQPEREQTGLQEAATPEHRETEVNQSFLDELEQDIEMFHEVGLQFSIHESTGRTIVKVVNKETDQTIREIPPEELLNLAAKLDEMLGILFDEKV
jgi:flagellar protein FlaG